MDANSKVSSSVISKKYIFYLYKCDGGIEPRPIEWLESMGRRWAYVGPKEAMSGVDWS